MPGGCDGVRAKWMQVVGQNTRFFFHFAHFASVFCNLKTVSNLPFFFVLVFF